MENEAKRSIARLLPCTRDPKRGSVVVAGCRRGREVLASRLHKIRVEVSATTRVAVAFATLVAVIVGAGLVAYRSYGESRDLTAAARQDRSDALAAERAMGNFWKERESIVEYLLAPSPAAAAEVAARKQAFEQLVATTHPESREETGQFAQAVKANSALIFNLNESRHRLVDRRAGQTILRTLHAAERQVLDPLRTVSRVNQTQYQHREALARSAAGDALRIELASALLALAGIAWFAVFATSLVRTIARQNDALSEADATKDDFINTISHELRTPITSIQGYVELLLDEEAVGADLLSDEQRRFLNTINRSSERLLHLVNDLLLIAQARAGRLEMDMRPCDLADIARHAVEDAQATAGKRDIALRFRPSVQRAPATADAARIGQAIDNLVSNAIKFTPAGGSVDVQISCAEDCSRITITDTGMGMSPAEVDQLFERFFRTQSAKEGNIQGTGLGLAITKMIVEAHGGTITLTSEPDVGTSFTISVPASGLNVDPALPCTRPVRPAWSGTPSQARNSTANL